MILSHEYLIVSYLLWQISIKHQSHDHPSVVFEVRHACANVIIFVVYHAIHALDRFCDFDDLCMGSWILQCLAFGNLYLHLNRSCEICCTAYMLDFQVVEMRCCYIAHVSKILSTCIYTFSSMYLHVLISTFIIPLIFN